MPKNPNLSSLKPDPNSDQLPETTLDSSINQSIHSSSENSSSDPNLSLEESVLARLKRQRQQQQAVQPPVEIENTLESLKAELAQYPQTKRHSAIVLEAALDDQLTQFCKQQQITVEVFLEAAWTLALGQPKLLEELKVEARQRYLKRKQAGKLRRLITMLETQNSG